MSNVPWPIPQHWRWARVTDIGSVVSGGTPSTKNAKFWGGEISWITPKDLSGYREKHISRGAKTITGAGLAHSSAKLIPAGSILFSSRAPIGYVAISKAPLATNQGFKNLIPNVDHSAEYLFWYFKSAKRLAEKRASGTTFKEISGKGFGSLPVPLCPLPEQHRIVEKIEALFSELDNGVRTLEAARKQLKVYRQAVLKHAFGGKLTEQWRKDNSETIGDPRTLCEKIQEERLEHHKSRLARWRAELSEWDAGGKRGLKPRKPIKPTRFTLPDWALNQVHLPAAWGIEAFGNTTALLRNGVSTKPEGLSGHRIFRISAIRPYEINYEDYRYLPEDHGALTSYALKDDDLLFTRYNGSRRYVGVCARFCSSNAYIFPDKLIQARLATTSIDPRFVMYALNCSISRGFLESRIRTTAGQSGISGGDIKVTPVPICSIEEQHEIVQEVESRLSVIADLENTIDENLRKAEALRQSILKKAFAGELVSAKNAEADESKTAAFPQPVEGIHTTDLHAGIVALALRAHERDPKYLKHFHRTKAEKISHLAEAHLGIDLGRHPVRDAAGPNDYQQLRKIESRAKKTQWLEVQERPERTDYARGRRFDALITRVEAALGERLADVASLLDTTLWMDTRQAEIVATAYAAWNNLLMDGTTPDDGQIVRASREQWHPDKLDIPRDSFFKAIGWMRDNGLIPAGRGRYVPARSK